MVILVLNVFLLFLLLKPQIFSEGAITSSEVVAMEPTTPETVALPLIPSVADSKENMEQTLLLPQKTLHHTFKIIQQHSLFQFFVPHMAITNQ